MINLLNPNFPRTLFACFMLLSSVSYAQKKSYRWDFVADQSIQWLTRPNSAHIDHIEMSGLQVSAIVHYGVSATGELQLQKKVIFPMLRTIPNNTHASLTVNFDDPKKLNVKVNGKDLLEYPKLFNLKGKLSITSSTNSMLEITRVLFPSVDKPALMEMVILKNKGSIPCIVSINNRNEMIKTDSAKGVYGQYIVSAELKDTTISIAPGQDYSFGLAYSGRKSTDQTYAYSASYELAKRDQLVSDLFRSLVLETPNDTLNKAFAFAKIRAAESIYDTKGGLMHGPGGGAYYAAIWANDQAEYANPFFPFLGNINGNESAINSYRHFARFMNSAYKPIPSSIVAEGADIWNGAGDRGDMAMIAYGASRFALASGNRDTARELWPLITWCFEYLKRQKTADGVFKSDNDELEGRFPAGKVNLSTSSLAYGGYVSAASLADELGQKELAETYRVNAQALRKAVEKYFGANVQGFNTYRYYNENTKLRAWICVPLVMGITERKEETIKALFSDYLWTSNGILTESGSKTFWDRSTLYAFRGLLASGATDRCMPYLNYYSATRLLGEHVPYPVEAWPEGDQRHLSAESALYCRVITEGLFGINPTGLNKFSLMPWLPKGWNTMSLKNVKAFARTFDIKVTRAGINEVITVKMENGTLLKKIWDGKKAIEFILP
jgi:hypothetical protein